MSTIQSKDNTNFYPLSLLKMLAMLMFLTLHYLGIGGVLEQTNSFCYYLLVACWKFFAVCINLYILVNCYYMIGQRFKVSRVFHLYIETVFYCLIWYIYAASSGVESFSAYDLVFKVFCPISSKQYWLFSGVIIVYLLSPILNFLINKLSQKGLLSICISFFLLFSCWVDIYPDLDNNIFNFSNGYSFHWYLVLFFFAAYIKLYVDPTKFRHPFLKYLILSLVVSAIAIVMPVLTQNVSLLTPWAEHFTRYNSILTTIASFSLFIAFLKIRINNRFIQKLITITAPLTLGVYFIHENNYGRPVIWHDILHTERVPGTIMVIPQSIVIVIILFFGCMIVDFLRQCLFNCLEERSFYHRMMNKMDSFCYSVLSRVAGYISNKF